MTESYVSKGREPRDVIRRHADDVTLARLIKLERDVRICREALTKIYWHTEDPFVSNVIGITIQEIADD